MLVELYGFAGVGKTTISKELAKRNPRVLLLYPLRKSEKLLLAGLFMVLHPIHTLRILRGLVRYADTLQTNTTRPRLIYWKFRSLGLKTFAQYQKYCFNKKRICIMDEGFYNLALSLFDTPSRNLPAFLSLLPRTHVVINMKSSEKTRHARMRKRNHFPREVFGKEYYEPWRKNQLISNNVIESYLAQNRSPQLVSLSTNQSAAKTAQRIMASLDSYSHDRSRRSAKRC